MEWLTRLYGGIVAIDTMPFIYLMEKNQRYFESVKLIFQAMDQGKFSGVTSIITLMEVLVLPLRLGNEELASKYRNILLGAKGLDVLDIDYKISEKAAEIRSKYTIRAPDAIQIATALCSDASFFVTNDIRLSSCKDIEIIILDNL